MNKEARIDDVIKRLFDNIEFSNEPRRLYDPLRYMIEIGGKMINRKILYGYRIRNGILEIVPEEQQTVKRIFTLYNAGASYQGISDALNQGNIPYSQEVPL